MMDGNKLRNYIKAEINPYGKPFEGTVYDFGLKLMDMIDRMEQSPQTSLNELERVELEKNSKEFETYKRALKIACSENNTNSICDIKSYKACSNKFGSCGECWECMYLQKARAQGNDS